MRNKSLTNRDMEELLQSMMDRVDILYGNLRPVYYAFDLSSPVVKSIEHDSDEEKLARKQDHHVQYDTNVPMSERMMALNDVVAALNVLTTLLEEERRSYGTTEHNS